MLKFCFILMVFLSPSLYALGNLGHETVCQIAYAELTPSAKKAVDDLLALETNPRFRTFSRACTWADDKNGGRNKARSADHYINLPRDWLSIEQPKCVLNKRCLFSAINDDITVLNSRANNHYKLTALKYLAHWIGDIHQPLHISYQDDYGGNQINTGSKKFCENLHSLWDRCLPEHLMRRLGFNPRSPKQKSQFAITLHKLIEPRNKVYWTVKLDPLIWANESYQLTLEPKLHYCVLTEDRCQTMPWKFTDQKTKISHSSKEAFNDDYLQAMDSVMQRRIQQAGIRLAAVLNNIFK